MSDLAPPEASAPEDSAPEDSAAAPLPDTEASEIGDVERVEQLSLARKRVRAELKKRIVGQDEVIDLLLTCLFARGHGLFVGVPGLAKTLLISTLSDVLSLNSNRIQFTPDLMPADITGSDLLEEDADGRRSFRFVKGPVFTNVLLADEINRTPPKTQAALLQAMAEGRVTAGGKTYPLAEPYVVFATQNPIEQEGTYPLPEAQLDRFLFQIDVGYPSAEDEEEIVRRTTAPPTQSPGSVLTQEEILAYQALVPRVPAASHVIAHAVALARASRPSEEASPEIVKSFVSFGAGPRASQALIAGAKARAVLDGRFAAEIEDVRALAQPALRHRIVTSFRADAQGIGASEVIAGILEAVRP